MAALFAGETEYLPISDWSDDTYIWKTDGQITLSLVIARNPGQGALNRLLAKIDADGMIAYVPCPLRQMQQILLKKGFEMLSPMLWKKAPTVKDNDA